MKRCIVIGKTNVGKTLFVLQFAAYLGADRLEITFEEPGGEKRTETLSVDQAIRQLSSQEPHQTRCLQSIRLELPVGKGVKRFDVVDTSGLIEGIHGDVKVRKAMAQTLAAVRDADLILHLVDAAKAGERGVLQAVGDVDYQVAQFAQMRDAYAILANKVDLPNADVGVEKIRQEFSGHVIIPISALHRRGFKEVKRFVWR
ncbi:MAG TPA: GTPase domain-containing protein, partial [Limnochordia bacterium]|nr:GTPase domain-containing protein [Limnochordia bacterium]